MPTSDTTELVADRAGERLDQFIARKLPAISRARAQRLIADGHVRAGTSPLKASLRLDEGQRVVVTLPPPERSAVTPETAPLDVIYEDGDIIVLNKPAGMAVHPAPGHARSTLVNAVLAHCQDLSGVGGVLRPGIVHRLDKDTSGIIVIAKHDAAHRALAEQWKRRTIEKTYLALVEGTPSPEAGVIDAPIARDPRHRQRMGIVTGGREAVTTYRVVERFDGAYALIEAMPRTGRTHQIRVHLSAIRHPIVGDAVYGRRSKLIERQFLHAWRLVFTHPRTGERMMLEAALPQDLETALRTLRK